MKNVTAIAILVLAAFSCLFAQNNPPVNALFPFSNGEKIGFINAKGEVVVAPVFYNAGAFSEGLAYARKTGVYGFIDGTGAFAIPPQFDYATSFSEGLALVYKNGRPFFINTKGEKVIDCPFKTVEPFTDGRAKVESFSEKYGIIDTQGRLLADTVFSRIAPFINGYAVVEGNESSEGNQKEVGVIDTTGKFILPFGKYYEIGPYSEGYFTVSFHQDNDSDSKEFFGVVDVNNRLFFLHSTENNYFHYNTAVHDGLLAINLYKYWLPEEEGVTYSSEKGYEGFVNLKGEIVINDTLNKYATEFSSNRAFVSKGHSSWLMINPKGEMVTNQSFDEVLYQGFHNGMAFVEMDDKWGLIDTNANFLIPPTFDEIDEAGIIEDYFFFIKHEPNEENGNYFEWVGIAKTDGTIMVEPTLQYVFSKNGFVDDLLYCLKDDKPTYINKKGAVIWQGEKPQPTYNPNINIDFMNRGHFYVTKEPYYDDPEVYQLNAAYAQPIAAPNTFPQKTLSLSVTIENSALLDKVIPIAKVFIANNLSKAIEFNVQDDRMYMKVQALNASGVWQDIEYLPSSWCGNSYYTVTLEPNHFWAFTTPIYEGDFKTQLRIELKYINPKGKNRKKKEVTIYSNTFEGSVNPGQFWRKPGYQPGGIMDPYFD